MGLEPEKKWIDLRSDTVTKPTFAMRAAMAEAEVGDDVYSEDPTVNRLEVRAAEIFGREAALFVPTGTMGNQIAAKLHTQPGEEIICEARSHVLDWEMATMASFSGCMPRTVAATRGVITAEQIGSSIAPDIYYRAKTGLIWIENSHNMAGGTVTPLDVLEPIWQLARERQIASHLDGARVFNAATTLGVDVATLTRGFDTVMFCLSKGLGAPVGSMLAGSGELIKRARSVRKALGGGMRQAGVLAAAGLIALEEMPKRLSEDHANARLLAEAVSGCAQAEIDMESVQTNIVIFAMRDGGSAPAFVAAMHKRGVLCSAIGPHHVRFVTHFDVSRSECEQCAETARELLS